MKFRLTPHIQRHVVKAMDHPEFSVVYEQEANEIKAIHVEEDTLYPVSMDLIEHVAPLTDAYFHELLAGSRLYFKPKETKPQDPAFVAYMASLRAQQQEREYQQMVSNVISSQDQKLNLGIKPDEIKTIKTHVVTILNIMFSMVAVYTAVYKASQTMTQEIGLQVLMGLGGAVLIGVVEVLLYMHYAFMSTSENKKKQKHRLTTL